MPARSESRRRASGLRPISSSVTSQIVLAAALRELLQLLDDHVLVVDDEFVAGVVIHRIDEEMLVGISDPHSCGAMMPRTVMTSH